MTKPGEFPHVKQSFSDISLLMSVASNNNFSYYTNLLLTIITGDVTNVKMYKSHPTTWENKKREVFQLDGFKLSIYISNKAYIHSSFDIVYILFRVN